MAALDGLQRPSLEALTPRLVERDELAAAAALNSLRMTFGMVAGPAIGGVLIATVGLPATYGVDLATFGVSLVACGDDARRAAAGRRGAAEPARASSRAFRYATSRAGARRHLRASTSSRCSSGCRSRSFPALAAKLGGAGRARPALRGARRGRAARDADERLDGRVHRHGVAVSRGRAAGAPASSSSGSRPASRSPASGSWSRASPTC